jgi:hypothetical protein
VHSSPTGTQMTETATTLAVRITNAKASPQIATYPLSVLWLVELN